MRFFAGYLASRVSNDCKVYPFTWVGGGGGGGGGRRCERCHLYTKEGGEVG